MDKIQRLNIAALQNVHTIKKALLKKILNYLYSIRNFHPNGLRSDLDWLDFVYRLYFSRCFEYKPPTISIDERSL